ncbi:hypothetical protein CQ054_10675 [Ochrobactrum sp. MYb29]|nr:hypothetical protein CQ054_10675 [Ochrobactrum sp. MYb29]
MSHNEGANIVYGAAAATAFLAVGAFNAHQRGMKAVRAARAADDDARYQVAVEQVIQDAEELGQLAMKLAKELAAERAKNTELQRALEQRQAVLDRIRNSTV